jgi:PEP-CTERM motif
MKSPFVAAVCLVALAFSGVALAGPGPSSPLYLTYAFDLNGGNSIVVVQGNSVSSFGEAYGPPDEVPIAVGGDVRTAGAFPGWLGGQYSLSGTPTGTAYPLPSIPGSAYDSTTDGSHNYLVDYTYGGVYQTARDFTNAVPLFTASGPYNVGITYDKANNSLWLSGWGATTVVTDYSMNGTVLSSFDTGHYENASLAMDPATHTLWLVDDENTFKLEQYSTAGVLLSTGPYVGYTLGGEFDMGATPTPEPGTLVMFGSGILGLAGLVRRKINL